MSLVKNLTESERIQKLKDRTLYANYLINQTKFQQGCNQIPKEIQSGSGSANQASIVTDIRLGALYTTVAERDAIVLTNSCPIAILPDNIVVTNGSLLFNGTTSQLLYTGVIAGTQAFTFEGWFYVTGDLGVRNVLYGSLYESAGNGNLSIYILSTTEIGIDRLGVFAYVFTVSSMSLNTWYHFAMCRNVAGDTTVFLNGTRASASTYAGGLPVVPGDTYNYKSSRYIGVWNSGGTGLTNYFQGNLAGFRVVIGSSVYNPNTNTITVPTQPLANITNTVLLLNTPTGPDYIKDTSSSGFVMTNTDVTSSVLYP